MKGLPLGLMLSISCFAQNAIPPINQGGARDAAQATASIVGPHGEKIHSFLPNSTPPPIGSTLHLHSSPCRIPIDPSGERRHHGSRLPGPRSTETKFDITIAPRSIHWLIRAQPAGPNSNQRAVLPN